MDIRNIKIQAPGLEEGHLEFLYEKGEEQLKAYKKIDDYGEYPLDVNTRKSQTILKDFIGRIIEELFEGYESIEQVIEILEEEGFNPTRFSANNATDILNGLQNANEEQADAIGFFISTLLFSNILAEDIYEYCRKTYGKRIISFNDVISLGVSRLYTNGAIQGQGHRSRYRILNYDLVSLSTGIQSNSELIEKTSSIREYSPGFNNLSPDELDVEMGQLWLVVYELNKARNLLKNRPWKQTEVMTKELEFQESLVKAFLYYLGYLADRGFDQDKIVTLFNRKQALNMWRINSGY